MNKLDALEKFISITFPTEWQAFLEQVEVDWNYDNSKLFDKSGKEQGEDEQ